MSTAQLNRTAEQINADLALARSAVQPSAPISSLSETATAKILTADERAVIGSVAAHISPELTLIAARSLGAL